MNFTKFMTALRGVKKATWAKAGALTLALLVAGGATYWWMSTRVRTDHFAAVPKNSLFVAKVNFGQLFSKSEVMEMDEFKDQLEELKEKLDDDDSRVSRLVKEILEDPRKSGLDPMSPVVLAVPDLSGQVLLVAAVSDKDDLTELIKTSIKSADLDLKVKDRDDYMMVEASREVNCAYNSKRLVVSINAGGGKAKPAGKYVMQDESESIMSQDEFKEFVESSDDVVCALNFTPLYDYAKKTSIPGVTDEQLNMLKGTTCTASLNFEEGKAVFRQKTNPSEALKKYYQQYTCEPKGNLLGQVPEDAFAAGQIGIAKFGQVVETALEGYLNYRQRREMAETLANLFGRGTSLSDVVDMISGDAVAYAALNPENPRSVPNWGIAFNCDQRLASVLRDSIGTSPSSDVKLTYGSDFIKISSPSGKMSSIKGTSNAAYLKGNSFFLDFQKMKPLAKNELEIADVLAYVSRLYGHSTGEYEYEIVLEFSDSKTNALCQIIKACIDIYENEQAGRYARVYHDYISSDDDYNSDWDSDYNSDYDSDWDSDNDDYFSEDAVPAEEEYYDEW